MKVRPKKTVIGTATCHCCGRDIPVKESETGTLDMSCQWCDLPMYAKKGTEAHRRLKARVTLFEAGPVPENRTIDGPEVVPTIVHEAPVRAAARGVFDLLAGRAS